MKDSRNNVTVFVHNRSMRLTTPIDLMLCVGERRTEFDISDPDFADASCWPLACFSAAESEPELMANLYFTQHNGCTQFLAVAAHDESYEPILDEAMGAYEDEETPEVYKRISLLLAHVFERLEAVGLRAGEIFLWSQIVK